MLLLGLLRELPVLLLGILRELLRVVGVPRSLRVQLRGPLPPLLLLLLGVLFRLLPKLLLRGAVPVTLGLQAQPVAQELAQVILHPPLGWFPRRLLWVLLLLLDDALQASGKPVVDRLLVKVHNSLHAAPQRGGLAALHELRHDAHHQVRLLSRPDGHDRRPGLEKGLAHRGHVAVPDVARPVVTEARAGEPLRGDVPEEKHGARRALPLYTDLAHRAHEAPVGDGVAFLPEASGARGILEGMREDDVAQHVVGRGRDEEERLVGVLADSLDVLLDPHVLEGLGAGVQRGEGVDEAAVFAGHLRVHPDLGQVVELRPKHMQGHGDLAVSALRHASGRLPPASRNLGDCVISGLPEAALTHAGGGTE
mmetsp:Transcript_81616/g.227109  ORF Transcript_81616/g.227109 Transcript_81616/m.227109 type:complete len:366 (+) Transcript_81616:234-1331(+)